MSGICDTCSLSNGCRKPIGGVDSCRRYVRAKESNYQCLFGTPERAARTFIGLHACSMGRDIECDECAALPICKLGTKVDYDALLEWLGGEVRDDTR